MFRLRVHAGFDNVCDRRNLRITPAKHRVCSCAISSGLDSWSTCWHSGDIQLSPSILVIAIEQTVMEDIGAIARCVARASLISALAVIVGV